MNTITIDCGASFIKAAKFNKDGEILCSLEKKSPTVTDSLDLTPVRIYSLISIINEIIEKLLDGEAEVRLGISNEMHGFLLAYEDGEPFTDYISWQKEYGNIEINGISSRDLLKKKLYLAHILNTGMHLRGGLPSCNLLYLSRIGALNKAKKSLTFWTLGDYLLRTISGKDCGVHPTNAAATGLYDLINGTWNQDIIENAGGKGIRFLPVCSDEAIFKIGKTVIYANSAIGDQQAALLGAGLQDEKEISFNIGTGAQVSMLTCDKTKKEKDAFQIRPYFGGKYIKTIPHIPSGRALNVYVRFFSDILTQFGFSVDDERIWQCILKAEQTATDTDMICDMSFFENAVTPETRGGLFNIGEFDLTLANLMNRIFKQMADNFISCADMLLPASQVRNVIFGGGVRKIDRIRNYIIKHYAPDVRVQVAEKETLRGIFTYVWQYGTSRT